MYLLDEPQSYNREFVVNPVLYSIFVLDMKIIRWEESVAKASGPMVATAPRVETTAAEAPL